MNYKNGREAKVGDGVVIVGAGDGILGAALSGMVSRVDLAQLQVLTFAERQNGAPYNLIPVTINGRHFEPVSFEASPETCLHAGDLAAAGEEEISNLKSQISKGEAVVGELAAAKAQAQELEDRLLRTGALLGEYQARFGELPTVVPADTTKESQIAEFKLQSGEPTPAATPEISNLKSEISNPSVAVVPEQPIQPS